MKPTCCCPLRAGVKFIALIDFLVSLVGIIGSVGALFYYELFTQEITDVLKNPPPELRIFINTPILDGLVIRILVGFAVVYWFQKFILGILLLSGTFKERKVVMRVWIVWTLLLLVLSVFCFLSVIALGVAEPYIIPFYVAAFLIREYSIWTAYAFLKRISSSNLLESYPAFANDKVMYKL